MAPILVFRHIECEGPGYLGDFLRERRIPFELIRIDGGDTVPEEPGDAAGLVFMGGPMSVNDTHEWIEKELNLIKSALKDGIPMLGHCLGGQLIAKALGADVVPNKIKEIGWYSVDKLPGKISDEWLGDSVTFPVTVFHWHGETFSIPSGATRILKSEFCENQGFVIGDILAMQCHVEITEKQVYEWSALYGDEITEPSKSIQSKGEMITDMASHIKTLQKLATCVYSRWLQGVIRYAERLPASDGVKK